MAALVLAAAIGSVAGFCPQDLRFESGARHPAKTTAAAAEPSPATTTPVVTPTTFTTVSAPVDPAPPTSAKKKSAHAHAPRSALPVTRGATTPSSSASAGAATTSATPALPENPYAQASTPATHGF